MGKRRRDAKPEAPADEPLGALAASLSKLGFSAPPASPAAPAPARPPAGSDLSAKLVLRKERKGRGGKTVTVLTGVGGDREAFAKRLRKALGCGAQVEGDTIVLQGDLRKRAEETLTKWGATRVVVGN